MTEKQIAELKHDVRKDLLDKVALIILAAVTDEVNLTDDQLCETMKRVNRYSDYIDQHKVHMKDIQNAIEKGTGIKLKGWSI